ncbi:MAG: NAD-dependent epimerase/dehydratase family protein [Actinomycetota bacterium]|nr:NAD-dependent epimerase/dehydratase family protein [Actinomycetota bacterium]
MDVRRSVAEPILDLKIDAGGTVLLESCVRHGVGRFVLAATGDAIYGEQRVFPASEDHPQYPISPYGVSKLAAERYLNYYRAQYGLPYVALRYANVYGPRQDPHGEAGVVAIFASRLSSGEECTNNGSGEQTRGYVYAGDVARANVLALAEGAPSGSCNVGTGVETSVNELYETMAELCGRGGCQRNTGRRSAASSCAAP